MILTIDIGNTTLHFGIFAEGRLRSQWRMATRSLSTPGRLRRALRALPKTKRLALSRSSQIICCSVVPHMSRVLTQALRSFGGPAIRLIGRDVRVPLKNRYRHPRQVGQDRLVGAYAAWRTYHRDCIVADFGTALTIDVVTRRGDYLGGIIAPGPGISLEALADKTALLPKVALRRPPELIGRDTANSIRSGVLYGSAALCDGLIGQLKRRYVPRATVVATGGTSRLIAPHTRLVDHVRPHLVLEGLSRLAHLEK